MADNTQEILKQFGDQLVIDLQRATPKASGETARSIHVEFTNTGFIIKGGSQIEALIDGRKPTSQGAVKGSPTLQEEILDWIRARSITPRESSMSQISLSWAISKSIHKNGYKGKGDIYSQILTKSRLASLTKTLIKSEALAIQSNVIKQFRS